MIRPLADNILVRRAEPDRMIAGLHIPDSVARSADSKPCTGTVVAVGPGKRGKSGDRIELAVQIGDSVVFSRYTGGPVPGDDSLIAMREEHVLAVLG